MVSKAMLVLAASAGAQAFVYSPPAVLRSSQVPTSKSAALPALRSANLHGLCARRARDSSRAAPRLLSVRAMAENVVDNVAVVLLAGGVGSRMKAGKPKQFLELEGKTILRTSLDIFLGLKGVTSISVVLAEEYRDQLADVAASDPRKCSSCMIVVLKIVLVCLLPSSRRRHLAPRSIRYAGTRLIMRDPTMCVPEQD